MPTSYPPTFIPAESGSRHGESGAPLQGSRDSQETKPAAEEEKKKEADDDSGECVSLLYIWHVCMYVWVTHQGQVN